MHSFLSNLRPILACWLGSQPNKGGKWTELPRLARIYLLHVWVAAILVAVFGIQPLTPSPKDLAIAFLFAGLICLLDQVPIGLISDEAEISLSVSVAIAASMLLPAPLIPLVALVGTGLAELRFTRPWYKKAFNVGQAVIVYTTLAWGFRYVADSDPLVLDSNRDLAAIAMLWAGNYVLNVSLVSLAISFVSGSAPLAVWRMNFRDVIYPQMTSVPLGVVLALAVHQQPLALLLLVPFLFALHRSFSLTREAQRQTLDALLAFADSIDAHDPSTYRHTQRVAELARAIAREMDLPYDEVETIQLSARLHDLGKVGIPDAVCLKAGSLSSEEYETIKEHPVIGARMVESFPIFGVGRDLMLHHHERYDGGGYPEGLSGEEIPLGARIIAVADAYDAMTSDRPYRRAQRHETAMRELRAEKGRKFDPKVVDAFVETMAVASEQTITPEKGEWSVHQPTLSLRLHTTQQVQPAPVQSASEPPNRYFRRRGRSP